MQINKEKLLSEIKNLYCKPESKEKCVFFTEVDSIGGCYACPINEIINLVENMVTENE